MRYVIHICKNKTERRKILNSFCLKHKDDNIRIDKFNNSIMFKDTNIKKLFVLNNSPLSIRFLRGYTIEKFYVHTALTDDETTFLNSRLNKTK